MTEISSNYYHLFLNAVIRLAIPSFVTTTSKPPRRRPRIEEEHIEVEVEMEEQREKTMLLGAEKTSGKEHGLGLMHPWVDYAVHIPFRVPRIPHSEGATFWDNWLHHTDGAPPPGSDPEASKSSSPAEPAPTPPLAVRLGALLLLFLLVFGPTLSYSSVGALYTQLKTDMGFTDGQLGFLFSAYALPNIVAVFFAGVGHSVCACACACACVSVRVCVMCVVSCYSCQWRR
jgi:hypothetical protein